MATRNNEARTGTENGLIWIDCPRCGGAGRLDHFNHVSGGVCFECDGERGYHESIEEIEAREAAAKRREAAAKRREEKARQKIAAKLAKTLADNPGWQRILDVAAEITVDEESATQVHPELKTRSHNDLLTLLRLADALKETGKLTQKQAAFALRLATPEPCPRCGSLDHAERDCPQRAKVTAGRQEVEGRLVSRKWRETAYGLTCKCLVACDDGRKLWGSFPTFKVKVAKGEWDYQRPEWGARVKFTAAVEPSDRDPHFGFFKRPTKAHMLEQGTREWDE